MKYLLSQVRKFKLNTSYLIHKHKTNQHNVLPSREGLDSPGTSAATLPGCLWPSPPGCRHRGPPAPRTVRRAIVFPLWNSCSRVLRPGLPSCLGGGEVGDVDAGRGGGSLTHAKGPACIYWLGRVPIVTCSCMARVSCSGNILLFFLYIRLSPLNVFKLKRMRAHAKRNRKIMSKKN